VPEGDWHTDVPCRRSPGRKRCLGEIFAELDADAVHIAWHCSVCGDNGFIHGWEDTFWNRQGGERAASSETPAHDEPLTRTEIGRHNDASHVSSAASSRHAGFRGA